jgi:hypothetical protein
LGIDADQKGRGGIRHAANRRSRKTAFSVRAVGGHNGNSARQLGHRLPKMLDSNFLVHFFVENGFNFSLFEMQRKQLF